MMLDLPRDGMEGLSVEQKKTPEENVLKLFGMISKGQEFWYALMALFFSFKDTCGQDELRPSKVIISKVERHSNEVSMRHGENNPATKIALPTSQQLSRGNNKASTGIFSIFRKRNQSSGRQHTTQKIRRTP